MGRMAKGKKGKKSKQDEDAEWDALEAKKTAQAAEPKPAAEPKKGKGKKSKAAAFMADLEEELKDEDLVNKMASVSVEEGLSKSQLKKQKREQKKKVVLLHWTRTKINKKLKKRNLKNFHRRNLTRNQIIKRLVLLPLKKVKTKMKSLKKRKKKLLKPQKSRKKTKRKIKKVKNRKRASMKMKKRPVVIKRNRRNQRRW